jgi:hypothetical protein
MTIPSYSVVCSEDDHSILFCLVQNVTNASYSVLFMFRTWPMHHILPCLCSERDHCILLCFVYAQNVTIPAYSVLFMLRTWPFQLVSAICWVITVYSATHETHKWSLLSKCTALIVKTYTAMAALKDAPHWLVCSVWCQGNLSLKCFGCGECWDSY